MKRRNFVLLAGAGIGAAAVAGYYYFSDVEYDIEMARPQGLSLIWDQETINAVGKQYRADRPDEGRTRSLVNLINADLSKSGGSLASRLSESVTNDFKTGKTVIVDGWILSVTEARQCALASTTA